MTLRTGVNIRAFLALPQAKRDVDGYQQIARTMVEG
jgi:hypothetical protein